MELNAFTSYRIWTPSYFSSPSVMRDEQRILVTRSSTENELWPSEGYRRANTTRAAVRNPQYPLDAGSIVRNTTIWDPGAPGGQISRVELPTSQYWDQIYGPNWQRFVMKKSTPEPGRSKYDAIAEDMVAQHLDINKKNVGEKNSEAESVTNSVDVKLQSVKLQRSYNTVYVAPQTVENRGLEIRPLLLDPGGMRASADVHADEATADRQAPSDSPPALSEKASPPPTISPVNMEIIRKRPLIAKRAKRGQGEIRHWQPDPGDAPPSADLPVTETTIQATPNEDKKMTSQPTGKTEKNPTTPNMDKSEIMSEDRKIHLFEVNFKSGTVSGWNRLKEPLKVSVEKSAILQSAVSVNNRPIRRRSFDPGGSLSPAGLNAIKTTGNQGRQERRPSNLIQGDHRHDR